MTLPKTYTVKEVAEIVDRSPETVRRWCRSGFIAHSQIGREYRISHADLRAWWKSRGGERLGGGDTQSFPVSIDLEAPENLDDARQFAERVGILADELKGVAAGLGAWSGALLETIETRKAELDEDDDDHADEWTEDLFNGEDDADTTQ